MIDFGTARDLGRTVKEIGRQDERLHRRLRPPEQIVGKPEARSDLFALAATLYHLATGKPPEGFHTAKDIETQLKDPHCSYPQEYRWFYELIRINLSEDMNDRYFSAKEIRGDLELKRGYKEIVCPNAEMQNAQQGSHTLLRQVRRAVDRCLNPCSTAARPTAWAAAFASIAAIDCVIRAATIWERTLNPGPPRGLASQRIQNVQHGLRLVLLIFAALAAK